MRFARGIYPFSEEKIVLFVRKSYGVGRQLRTLQKHLPAHLKFIPFSFDTGLEENTLITRENWMKSELGRSVVVGEYIRIICYGKIGGIQEIESEIPGLEDTVRTY